MEALFAVSLTEGPSSSKHRFTSSSSSELSNLVTTNFRIRAFTASAEASSGFRPKVSSLIFSVKSVSIRCSFNVAPLYSC